MLQQLSFLKVKFSTPILLTVIFGIVVLTLGYKVIYPYALDFAISRPNISVNQQELMAGYFTSVCQISIIHLFYRCQYSFNLLKKNAESTSSLDILLPIIHGLMAFPVGYTLVTVLF